MEKKISKKITDKPKNPSKHPGGRPLLFKTVKKLQKKIDSYFLSCWDYKRDMFGNRVIDREGKKETKDIKSFGYVMEQVKPFTVSGLAVFLNTSRETLMNYQKKNEFFDTIKEAKDRIEAYAEESLYIVKGGGPIFVMKNNYGWRDTQHIDQDVHEYLHEDLSGKDVNELKAELKRLEKVGKG